MEVLEEIISASEVLEAEACDARDIARLTEAARAAGAGAWLADVMLPIAVRAAVSNTANGNVRTPGYLSDVAAALADVAAAADAARENDTPSGEVAALLSVGRSYVAGVFYFIDADLSAADSLNECDMQITSNHIQVAEYLRGYSGNTDRILCLVARALMIHGNYIVVGSAAAEAIIKRVGARVLSRDAVIAFLCCDCVHVWLSRNFAVTEAIAKMLKMQLYLPPIVV